MININNANSCLMWKCKICQKRIACIEIRAKRVSWVFADSYIWFSYGLEKLQVSTSFVTIFLKYIKSLKFRRKSEKTLKLMKPARWLPTISFITFWNFLIFHQIFPSPQVKLWTIITYENGIYELPHELPNS